MSRWSDRWTATGVNSAGDPMYTREARGTALAQDLSGLTKAELQKEAEAAGLSTSGTKADLIARLSE